MLLYIDLNAQIFCDRVLRHCERKSLPDSIQLLKRELMEQTTEKAVESRVTSVAMLFGMSFVVFSLMLCGCGKKQEGQDKRGQKEQTGKEEVSEKGKRPKRV